MRPTQGQCPVKAPLKRRIASRLRWGTPVKNATPREVNARGGAVAFPGVATSSPPPSGLLKRP
jgi:hypothetical protein